MMVLDTRAMSARFKGQDGRGRHDGAAFKITQTGRAARMYNPPPSTYRMFHGCSLNLNGLDMSMHKSTVR